MRISIPSNLDFELSHLQQRAAAGERFKYVFFWGHTPSKNEVGKECLSQWYASPFDLDGITYRTAEHFMMAEKARLFGDQTKCAQIIEADSPGKAKALGREVVGFDQDRWEAHRIAIAIRGNVAKFSRHQGLGEFLRNTGTRVLVEASPRDRIWGIGLDAKDPRCQNPSLWQGANLLGFSLMAVRELIDSPR